MNQQKIMIKQKTVFHDFEKIIIFLTKQDLDIQVLLETQIANLRFNSLM